MSRRTVARAAAAAAAVAVALAATAGCEWDIERMIDQPRYDVYDPCEVCPGGTIMQAPPPGTVPRTRVIGPPELVRGVNGDGFAEAIPIPVDRELLARGRGRYDIFCAACHGRLGDGRTIVAENMPLAPPPSLLLPRIRELPPGRVYAAIAEGYGLMPSYAAQLDIADRWAVVAYLSALQLSQRVELEELPARIREEAEAWLR
jgi:mono/diheme cytochrome c family protein